MFLVQVLVLFGKKNMEVALYILKLKHLCNHRNLQGQFLSVSPYVLILFFILYSCFWLLKVDWLIAGINGMPFLPSLLMHIAHWRFVSKCGWNGPLKGKYIFEKLGEGSGLSLQQHRVGDGVELRFSLLEFYSEIRFSVLLVKNIKGAVQIHQRKRSTEKADFSKPQFVGNWYIPPSPAFWLEMGVNYWELFDVKPQ